MKVKPKQSTYLMVFRNLMGGGCYVRCRANQIWEAEETPNGNIYMERKNVSMYIQREIFENNFTEIEE